MTDNQNPMVLRGKAQRQAMIGKTYGTLTVVSEIRYKDRNALLCKCVCGNDHIGFSANLLLGMLKNCGCRRLERIRSQSLKHGHNKLGRRSKEYRAWCHIRGRCENPNDSGYASYGGRGIRVADEWHSFDRFLADMGEAPSPRHSIDRIDNDGNYEPGNCRWATPSQQARNTSRTIFVRPGLALIDACSELGVSYGAATARLRNGAPIEQALSPLKGAAYRKAYGGSNG